MDGFSGYNQIQIHPVDQYKTAFITPWGTFAYRVMPFGLKNIGATFQRAMTYIFHDLAKIILAYLDDLIARSKKRTQYLNDLRIIFQWCCQYNIHLNPLKCVFCVTAGRLLGFIVSQRGITMEPLKVQAITKIPPPRNLWQLQSLQGKSNFLRRFVPDYAIRAHGFLRLLRHDIPFHWDDHAQHSFDYLKAALSNTPLISAPDYNRDYILYVSASAVSLARAPPALLHPVITASPFCKWGINFMTCNPPSNNGHKYIVVVVDYFTKWAEAMPTFKNTADTAARFFFNHVISRFGLPLQLVFDHGKHFENEIFVELSSRLVFSHEFSSPYYP
jgi:hypothetical protein